MTCDEVEEEVVAISRGSLIKITGSKPLFRTPTELTCRGLGIYADNSEVMTRYRAYVDEDGDVMAAYDTDGAQAKARRAADQAHHEEIEQITSAFNSSVDKALSEF